VQPVAPTAAAPKATPLPPSSQNDHVVARLSLPRSPAIRALASRLLTWLTPVLRFFRKVSTTGSPSSPAC
jgi:hypothetical protein